MQRSIIVRLLSIIPVVLVVSFATFTMIELIPGDAASIRLGEEATPEEVEQLRKDLGLDKGFLERYGDWLVNAVQGDLGTSLRSNRPVLEQIRDRLTPTIWLGAGAVVLAIVVAIPIGVISATAPGSKRDIVGTYFATLGIALPEFVIGVILVLVFAVRLGWFPTSGWVDPLDDPVQGLKHLILPWIAMAGVSTASLSRMIRSSMIEVLGHDYIRTAYAKGLLSFTILWRHALRNALLSTVTLLGLIVRKVIGGAVVIEVLFAIPGMGRFLVDSVVFKDSDAILGIVVVLAVGVVMINTLIEISYAFLDPRIRQA